jgi:hypothetical protein
VSTDNNQITIDFGVQNEKYKFNPTTQTINLSGMVFDKYQNNIIQKAAPLNDEYRIYDYVEPSDLLNYNTFGFYSLSSLLINTGYGFGYVYNEVSDIVFSPPSLATLSYYS